SWEDLSARYQAELANGFGNLASRVIAMVLRYRDGVVPEAGELALQDAAIRNAAETATQLADGAIDRMAIHEAIAAVWQLVDELNGYLTEQEPWALAKDPAKAARLDTVLATAVHGLGTLAVLLAPVLPKATAKLWTALGGDGSPAGQPIHRAHEWTGSGRVSALESGLFPRIEVEETEGSVA
ncbi:MAG: class I tRNA ligase family protein, partial [Actinomycetota bacterium]|nr:class I tRNA ligase family protein [Actinomycetota bacterium]